MISKYHEKSIEVELHSDTHRDCNHELEEGWRCDCSACQCESIVTVQASFSYNGECNHAVIVRPNPHLFDGGMLTLPPNVARALASALMFAANDAETLDKEFPL